MIRKLNCDFYVLMINHKHDHTSYSLINSEQPGVFNSENAKSYAVPFGPLHGSFKAGQNCILPDGFIIYSADFIYGYYLGNEIVLIDSILGKLDAKIIKTAAYLICC